MAVCVLRLLLAVTLDQLAINSQLFMHNTTIPSSALIAGSGSLIGPGVGEMGGLQAPATRTITQFAGMLNVSCATSANLSLTYVRSFTHSQPTPLDHNFCFFPLSDTFPFLCAVLCCAVLCCAVV